MRKAIIITVAIILVIALMVYLIVNYLFIGCFFIWILSYVIGIIIGGGRE